MSKDNDLWVNTSDVLEKVVNGMVKYSQNWFKQYIVNKEVINQLLR